MVNPYDVERGFPDYFLEHRRLTVEQQGTYRCGELPMWTVYCPAGYLGNSTVIEGDDGLIVYDTGVNMEAGRVISAEIAKISDKPIKAIFYSHHHTDHYNGTRALVDPADVESGAVKIYAWENFIAERDNEFGEILPRQSMGSAYYGGAFLSPEDRHHHGIGTVPAGGEAGFIPPTDLLHGDETLTIAGVRIDAFYTGGEAISEFGIHLPDLDAVIIADEFFTGIPNMHTIRGSKPRMPENYLTALDRVLEIGPHWLLGSHIQPIEGEDRIRDVVTKYRDATQYLWDQSVRLINKGYTPTELQHALKDLPEGVWDAPYVVPMYGTPFTTVPEFFTGWVSWFSGDSTELFPSPPAHRARRMVELMGGADAVVAAAKADHEAGDHQLAAELTQLAVRADPDHEDARLLKAAALRARGYQELNPIARSWYLTGALELEGAFDTGDLLRAMLGLLGAPQSPVETVRGWRYHLDAEKAAGRTLAVGLRFDTGDEVTVRVRHQVLVVQDGVADDADAVVELTAADLDGTTPVSATTGDVAAWTELQGLLDREIKGFNMHMR
ncbi:alkyl sulfatase dimerization domain-containing protein [Streptomyces sp. MMBL 11-1]|uniref:alkyl sulfatase dimerization domain-containing protein n=1 Tax=Streptomyces sp. MMBL 11-1 TaxID=3026420 RepID=UPI00235F9D4F|nr:alkyl sulfatase dimerization domain-containing protein [Streptomyces sp. MMBL 11-1]